MKNIYYFFLLAFLLGSNLFGQNCVSGYVDIKNPKNWERQVYLSQLHPKENSNTFYDTQIASSPIAADGYFTFDQNLFTTKEHIYKLHIKPLSPKEKDTLSKKVKNFELFILSKNDTIHFDKSEQLFTKQTSNNKANHEWQKLKNFEARYENLTSDFDTKKYLLETKGYVKDSLQILLVKLIGIKRLDDQGLLEKDAQANPTYYLSLIKELKSSDLDPSTYVYLENKLQTITQKTTNKKYTISLWANAFAIFIICILLLIIIKFLRNQKKQKPIPLSKQEKVIKNLIISGKSNKEIANELFISLSTVKTHISNIYSKLNISSRQDLLLKK
ncbi:response regulator transcription factor [Aquimarina sp. I32.4]|uniref:helix-turn-helix domain-containing protein n=1 Tax=Aquimarina sp. I32.4 TaxID=2053903 RepID=UPI000CDE9A2B|nr:response regulator transcription factor [Aquimarina sp. I32.4]